MAALNFQSSGFGAHLRNSAPKYHVAFDNVGGPHMVSKAQPIVVMPLVAARIEELQKVEVLQEFPVATAVVPPKKRTVRKKKV